MAYAVKISRIVALTVAFVCQFGLSMAWSQTADLQAFFRTACAVRSPSGTVETPAGRRFSRRKRGVAIRRVAAGSTAIWLLTLR